MTELEMVLYTAVFTTVLTTFATILLKRFDSRQAENDRNLNNEIARLNREYEVKTTLRAKYEKMYAAFLKFERWIDEFLHLELFKSDSKMHEFITYTNDISLNLEKEQALDRLKSREEDPNDYIPRNLGQLVSKHNQVMHHVRGNATNEFHSKLSEFAFKYTFIPPEQNEEAPV